MILMTLEQIKTSDKVFLTPGDIAPVLRCDPHTLRMQAHADPAKLGFPVTVMGSRIKINRKAFLEYLGE